MKERLSLTPGTPRFTARSNRILSKVQKSFWSCTHVNSCQKYILYINLHVLLNILSKTTQIFKNQENPSSS